MNHLGLVSPLVFLHVTLVHGSSSRATERTWKTNWLPEQVPSTPPTAGGYLDDVLLWCRVSTLHHSTPTFSASLLVVRYAKGVSAPPTDCPSTSGRVMSENVIVTGLLLALLLTISAYPVSSTECVYSGHRAAFLPSQHARRTPATAFDLPSADLLTQLASMCVQARTAQLCLSMAARRCNLSSILSIC